MRYWQEDALRVTGSCQILAGQHPVTSAIPAASRLHMSRPVPDVEMETRVKERPRQRTHELHEQIFTGSDYRVRELAHTAKRACYFKEGKAGQSFSLHSIEGID